MNEFHECKKWVCECQSINVITPEDTDPTCYKCNLKLYDLMKKQSYINLRNEFRKNYNTQVCFIRCILDYIKKNNLFDEKTIKFVIKNEWTKVQNNDDMYSTYQTLY